MSPNSLPGSVKRYMRTQACKGLDAHMVDVICWSLLQTRRCCVELTNSPVSPAGVWFELSSLSLGLRAGKGKAADTPAVKKCGAVRYCRCFSLCRFKMARLDINWMIHAFLSPINKSRCTFKLIIGLLPSISQWDSIQILVENDFTALPIPTSSNLWGKQVRRI